MAACSGLPPNRKLTAEDRRRGCLASAKLRAALAVAAYEDVAPEIHALHAQGQSLRDIAAALTDAGLMTRHGRAWNHVQVARVLARGEPTRV